MRRLVIYLRSLFCKHEWEFLDKTQCWCNEISTVRPVQFIDRWRCTKCGYIMKDKY